MTKAEQALIDANAIIGQFLPLVGIIGLTVRTIAGLLRRNGDEAEAVAFEDEYAKYEASLDGLQDAIDEFNEKYPSD